MWRVVALVRSPDVEGSIKRGCALRPRRHRTLPQVKDRDMHEELRRICVFCTHILYDDIIIIIVKLIGGSG